MKEVIVLQHPTIYFFSLSCSHWSQPTYICSKYK